MSRRLLPSILLGATALLAVPRLLQALWDGVLAGVRARLGGVREVRFAPYLPHVTVGTFPGSGPTGPVAEAIVYQGGKPIGRDNHNFALVRFSR